jgi:hypothetical protein
MYPRFQNPVFGFLSGAFLAGSNALAYAIVAVVWLPSSPSSVKKSGNSLCGRQSLIAAEAEWYPMWPRVLDGLIGTATAWFENGQNRSWRLPERLEATVAN